MGMNEAIAWLNVVIAAGLVAIAVGLFASSANQLAGKHWRAWWPVPDTAALGGVFLSLGLVTMNLVLIRTFDDPMLDMGRHGLGTFVLRVAAAVLVIAMARRVFFGDISDRGESGVR